MHALVLEVRKNGLLVCAQSFEQELVKIGRIASCDLRIDDHQVARIQAVVETSYSSEGFWVTNMGGVNQTTLNGTTFKRAKLVAGDELRVGDHVIRVLAEPVTKRMESITDDLLLVPVTDEIIVAPIAKVLWSATAEEMATEPPTGEIESPFVETKRV